MMVVGGQVGLVPWNITSATLQVEPGGGMNSRAITGCIMSCDMHILTRESQEVVVGTENVPSAPKTFDIVAAERSLIV